MEIQFIYVVKNNNPINWSHVIMHHMMTHGEKSGGLPYARFKTKSFKFCGIDTMDELRVKMTEKMILTLLWSTIKWEYIFVQMKGS